MSEISICFVKIAERLEKEREKSNGYAVDMLDRVDEALASVYMAAKYLGEGREVLDKIKGRREKPPHLAKGVYYTFEEE